MSKNKSNSLFESKQVKEALVQSFVKLNPKVMFKNPVMFTVEIGTAIMFIVCIAILMGAQNQGSFIYNFLVFLILFITLLFANFAEAIAEARGKAQADSLRKTREETPAKKIEVCYQSCNPAFGERIADDVKQRVKEHYKLPDRYFLYVGSIIERKNLLNLCTAMNLLRNDIDIPLVVIGNGGEYKQKVKDYRVDLNGHVNLIR